MECAFVALKGASVSGLVAILSQEAVVRERGASALAALQRLPSDVLLHWDHEAGFRRR